MNVLSIAIASLVLFASQAAGQVSVNKIFDGKGGYIMEYTLFLFVATFIRNTSKVIG